MVALTELLLPVLLSGVAVFIVSSVIHMCTPMHKGDYAGLPNEDTLRPALREGGLKPGQYMFPKPASMKEMGEPHMLAKYEEGPVGYMSVLPNGPPAMGKALGLWFLYSLIISLFAAYLATLAVEKGAAYMDVFQVTSTVAFLGYAFGNVSDWLWKGGKGSTTFKFMIDGLIYSLVTAGVFASMWPSA